MLVPEAIFHLVRGVKIKSEKPGGGYTGFSPPDLVCIGGGWNQNQAADILEDKGARVRGQAPKKRLRKSKSR